MSIKLFSITEDDAKLNTFFTWVFEKAQAPMPETGRSGDGKVWHCETPLKDELSGGTFGKIIYTLAKQPSEEGAPETAILDVDMALCGYESITLKLEKEFGNYADWNRNYIAAECEADHHFVAEAANRFAGSDELEGKTVNAALSAFPFNFDLFGSLEELNRCVFGDKVEGEGDPVGFCGVLDSFTCPSMRTKDMPFSTIVGIVKGFRDMRMNVGGESFDFIIADLQTGLGTLPTVVSRERFDLEDLAEGRYVIMNAYVTAELLVD